MAYLLILKQKGRGEFKVKLGECINFIPKDLEQIAYFPYLSDLEGVKDYLEENQVATQKRFKVQSFFRHSLSVKREKAKILELISFGLDQERFKSSFDQLEYKDKVSQIHSTFWQDLFSLNLAYHSGNKPWLTQLTRRLGQISPYYFTINGLALQKEELKMVRDYILELLEKLAERPVDRERVKILARRISQMGQTESYQEIADELDAQWSLTELRAVFQNPLWKNVYFDFWYSLIVDRTTEAEVDGKLRDVLTKDLVANAPFDQLWVFEHFLPADEQVREELYKRVRDKWKRGGLLESFQILQMLKVSPIKTALANDVKDLNRANFQLMREYFIQLLNSGYSTQVALYQLYKLGDKQTDHLWWLVI